MNKTQTISHAPKEPYIREDTLLSYTEYQNILTNHIKSRRKDHGIFFTPERIVDFMVGLLEIKRNYDKSDVAILEPACGLAQFLIGIKRNSLALFKKSKLFGVEINQDIVNYLKNLNIGNDINLTTTDFLLWKPEQRFNFIIGNPPYGIPSLSEHYTIRVDSDIKQKYKDIYETWYGKYNVYGAFIEKSIKLLKPEGQLVFIVPGTFMILDEFKKLRYFLAKNGQTNIIYLGPDVFKPEADVSSVVLNFHKSDKSKSTQKLLEYKDNKICIVRENRCWNGEVIKFETDYTRDIENICSNLLGDIYEIRISPRTPEIKQNSHIIKKDYLKENNYLPLLNGRNLKCNKIDYDNYTGFCVKKNNLKYLRGYFDNPHIVVGLGFRESGKVAAAYDEKCYPWMGDIYHLLRKNILFVTQLVMNDIEILEYLNSNILKKYVKDTYREITYHLSITQLKNLPLPDKKEWQRIRSLHYDE